MDAETKLIIEQSLTGIIIVNLDGTRMYNALCLKDLRLALKRKEPMIITPLTLAIDNSLVLDGYRVIIESEGQSRCLNDMLLGDIGENDKELRLSHNAEKLFLAGVYDNIETSWEQI